jgi:hypothetical protein
MDTQWQQDFIDGINEEVSIFEIDQQSQVYRHRKRQKEFSVEGIFFLIHPPDQEKIQECARKNHSYKLRRPPAVKENTENQNYRIPEFFGSSIIAYQKCG